MFQIIILLWLLFIKMNCNVNSKGVLSEYKGKQYMYVQPENQDPSKECEIPPLEEEDLTHFRRKRMITKEKQNDCIESYPYLLSVRYRNNTVCLGALVNYHYALTTFGCVKESIDKTKFDKYIEGSYRFYKLIDLSVRVGSVFRDFGGRLLAVIKVYFENDKNPQDLKDYDIILLKMNVYTTPTPGRIGVGLPADGTRIFNELEVASYKSNENTGETEQGDIKQQIIRHEFLSPKGWDTCKDKLDEADKGLDPKLFICTENKETRETFKLCSADEGAPLINNFGGVKSNPHIMGIATKFGMKNCKKTNDTSNQNRNPAIFTNVIPHVKWIRNVFKVDAEKEETFSYSQTECQQYPQYNLNLRHLRRKKRLTTQVGLVCLEDYPYTVSVRIHGQHWCGGAIVDDWWILTSAQCFDNVNKEDVTVRMGSVFRDYGGKILAVTALEKHPKYKKGKDYPAYNLAMLQINMPIFHSVRIQTVKLIPPSSVRLEHWGGENCVTGYGAVKSPILEEGVNQELRMITVKRILLRDCQKAYEGITEIKEDQLCMQSLVKGVNLCTGDLGDPLVQFNSQEKNGILYGLAIYPGKDECNSSRPFIFTKIRPSWHWIDAVIRDGLPEETEGPPTTKPVLRNAKEASSEVLQRSVLTKNELMFNVKPCETEPLYELDLRHVNLTMDRRRRRRKRMTVTGKQGLACLEDYPYTVAILKNHEEVICSGAIVAKQWVLTAAVCVEKCSRPACHNLKSYRQLSIRMGSVFGRTGGRLVSVIDIRVHHDFNPLDKSAWKDDVSLGGNDYPLHDLAMLKFNIPYRSSPRMFRVRLPENQGVQALEYEQNMQLGGRFIVSGFGGKWSGQPDNGYNDLRAIEVMYEDVTRSDHTCASLVQNVGHNMWINRFRKYYSMLGMVENYEPNYRHLCMVSKDANLTFCVGDNGMPLVHFDGHDSTPVLLGIHVTYYNKNNCLPMYPKVFPGLYEGYEDTPVPGIFVRVSVYVKEFIQKTLEDEENSEKNFLLAYAGDSPLGVPHDPSEKPPAQTTCP